MAEDGLASPLDIERVRSATAGSIIGSEIAYFERVDSTNTVARDALSACPGRVIIAEHQTAGRGRNGRSWEAPPGSSLLLTVAVRPGSTVLPGDAVMWGAVSVCETVRSFSGCTTALKWPNDVLVNGKKISGILAEQRILKDDVEFLLGMGINVNIDAQVVSCLGSGATSLRAEIGKVVSREDLLIALLRRLNVWYGVLTRDADILFKTWRENLITVGAGVTVADTTGMWTGTALDVKRDGGLIVRRHNGAVLTVYAGDVSLR